MVREVLESSGISAMITNEHASSTSGAGFLGALSYAWPEVWVLKDEEVENAIECLKLSGLSFLENNK